MKCHGPTRLAVLFASLALTCGVAAQTLPATFDLRNIDGHSYIGPVHNQGTVGTCYAFSGLAAAESTYNRATSRYDAATADFSESFVVWSLSPLYSGLSGIYGSSYEFDDPGSSRRLRRSRRVRLSVCADRSLVPTTSTGMLRACSSPAGTASPPTTSKR